MREIPVVLVAEPTASACQCDRPVLHWSDTEGYGRGPRRVYFYCAGCRTFGFIAYPAESWGKASILDGESRQGLTDKALAAFSVIPDAEELMSIFRRIADDVFDRRSRCAELHIETIGADIANSATDLIQRRADERLGQHWSRMAALEAEQGRLVDQLSRKVKDRRRASSRALARRKAVEQSEFPVIFRGRENHGVTIYGLIDPREPTRIRYVGQAQKPAARLASHITGSERGRFTKKDAWIAELAEADVYPDMVLLERTRPGADPDTLERWWIAQMVAKGQADTNTASLPKRDRSSDEAIHG